MISSKYLIRFLGISLVVPFCLFAGNGDKKSLREVAAIFKDKTLASFKKGPSNGAAAAVSLAAGTVVARYGVDALANHAAIKGFISDTTASKIKYGAEYIQKGTAANAATVVALGLLGSNKKGNVLLNIATYAGAEYCVEKIAARYGINTKDGLNWYVAQAAKVITSGAATVLVANATNTKSDFKL